MKIEVDFCLSIKILTINPGSTSTKIGLFENNQCIYKKTIHHESKMLDNFKSVVDQYEFRTNTILNTLKEWQVNIADIDAFAGRGGLMKPLSSGTYIVNNAMIEDLKSCNYGEHASNLGAIIASNLAATNKRMAFVVNPVVVDEMAEETKFTGLPQISRVSAFHALNQKAAALRASDEIGIKYEDARYIVVHLGGGISIGAHLSGKVVDVNNALEEGPFSPERAGTLPTAQLVDLCFSGKFTKEEIKKMLAGKGGLIAYTGLNDFKKILALSSQDNNITKLIQAMVYSISKHICSYSAILEGVVDRIILTGGLANESIITEGITKRVSFLAPVLVYPGEDELAALAEGTLRVLMGLELAKKY